MIRKRPEGETQPFDLVSSHAAGNVESEDDSQRSRYALSLFDLEERDRLLDAVRVNLKVFLTQVLYRTAIGVDRDRFLPVKTTSDLLVLRSDAYDLQADGRLMKATDLTPVVDLDNEYYKIIGDFDHRFPAGAPSLKEARYLEVNGDWTFEAGVRVIGEVTLDDRGTPQIIAAGSILSEETEQASQPG